MAPRVLPTTAGSGEPTIRTTPAYQGDIIGVRIDTVGLPNGLEATREIVEHPSSVCIVPLDGEGNLLMVRQYRKAAKEFLIEVPAGKMEGSEDPESTTSRELREEIGHAAGRLRKLGAFYSAPGWCTQMIHAYLATELTPSRLDADYDEFIEVVRLPFEEVMDLVTAGTIRDAKSVAALLLAMRVLGDN